MNPERCDGAIVGALLKRSVIVGLLALGGCDRLWDALNRGALRRDLEQLCAMHGVTIRPSECRMIGATRDGACSAQFSKEDIQRLVKGIGLVRADTLPEYDSVGSAARRMVTTCCSGAWTAEGVEIYAAFDRPPSLRLANGTAFEHLIIVFRPQANEACLCASYAYG